MNISLVLAILGPISILVYIYFDYQNDKNRKKKSLENSINSIESVLYQTEANSGDRKYEEEYVKNGEKILNHTSFFLLNDVKNLNIPSNDND